ncbi:C-C motif chemokine 20b [Mastacembelus armatus]|uniref:C-C motif chemokine n=1 Tax=Mastacembelus armatus TaxID=205130 RepID=A0A3Q3LT28_9TELE|nr:C-C motif chemokine 20-like [Mastacembelus armatus]
MASGKVCVLAAVCALVILTTLISSTDSASCCLRYTRRPLPCKRLLGYSIQTINTSCDINAIIFHLQGRFVCADPSMQWTQRAMKCLDEMERRKNQIIEEQIHGNSTSA